MAYRNGFDDTQLCFVLRFPHHAERNFTNGLFRRRRGCRTNLATKCLRPCSPRWWRPCICSCLHFEWNISVLRCRQIPLGPDKSTEQTPSKGQQNIKQMAVAPQKKKMLRIVCSQDKYWALMHISIPFADDGPHHLPDVPQSAMEDIAASARQLEMRWRSCRLLLTRTAFIPFVADAYGVLRTDARYMVSTLIQCHHSRFAPLTAAEVGRAVWSTVSAAAVARAAMQLQ